MRPLLLAVGAAMLLAVAWLLRDPEPVFRRRAGLVAAVDTLAVTPDGPWTEQTWRVRASSGLAVTIAIRHATADTGRRPLILVLGGQRRGRGATALVRDPRGTVLAALDYPYDGDPAPHGLAGLLRQLPAIRRAFYDTPPAVTLALDALLARPDVDPRQVELIGASFGAPFAVIAAARDRRVTRLWVAQGGGRPYGLLEQGLRRQVPMTVARVPLAALATLLISGPRFAPEHWIGDVSPRPVVLLDARDDERIPRRSQEALWAAAEPPKSRIWLDGPHMLGSRPQVIRAVVDSVMAHLADPPAPIPPH